MTKIVWRFLIVTVIVFLVSEITVGQSSRHVSGTKVPPPGEMVDIGGYRLHLNIRGNNQGPTIVIEAGSGSWSLLWQDVQKELSKHARVVIYDRAGYGWSDASPWPRTFEQIAMELNTALDSAGVKPPYVLLGHSYGGYIVRSFLKQFPERVDKIILAESAYENQFEKLPAILGMLVQKSNQSNKQKAKEIRLGNLKMEDMAIDSTLSKKDWEAYQYCRSRASFYEAMYNELYLMPFAYEQSIIENPVQKPLLVITAGNSFQAFAGVPQIPIKESNKIWMDLQNKLLDISTNSRQVILENATHNLKKSAKQEFVNEILSFF